MLVGLNFAYLGLTYKFLQPNLMMGIIELHHIHTLGLEPATFVLWMALLTFSVVGGGLRGCATAAEIQEIVSSALVSYPAIGRGEPRILLFEVDNEIIPQFDPAMGQAARRRLNKMGVAVLTGTRVTAFTPDQVVLMSGQRIPCRTVVGTLTARPIMRSLMRSFAREIKGTAPISFYPVRWKC